MKIRTGFVSNSSSSSFIIGVGIVPSDKIAEVRESLGLDSGRNWEIELKSPEDIGSSGWGIQYNRDRDIISHEAFNGQEVSIMGVSNYLEQDPGAMILHLHASGTEPTYDEDSWEYNYDDIDESLEWFSQVELDAADIIRTVCVDGSVTTGGGFDG